jgi:hypothetical protein
MSSAQFHCNCSIYIPPYWNLGNGAAAQQPQPPLSATSSTTFELKNGCKIKNEPLQGRESWRFLKKSSKKTKKK